MNKLKGVLAAASEVEVKPMLAAARYRCWCNRCHCVLCLRREGDLHIPAAPTRLGSRYTPWAHQDCAHS